MPNTSMNFADFKLTEYSSYRGKEKSTPIYDIHDTFGVIKRRLKKVIGKPSGYCSSYWWFNLNGIDYIVTFHSVRKTPLIVETKEVIGVLSKSQFLEWLEWASRNYTESLYERTAKQRPF